MYSLPSTAAHTPTGIQNAGSDLESSHSGPQTPRQSMHLGVAPRELR